MSDKRKFEVKGHSYQIADTGDYDGHWEITDGRVSVFTKEECEEEDLQVIADALNEFAGNFYLDDSDTFLMHHFEEELKKAEARLQQLEAPPPADIAAIEKEAEEISQRRFDSNVADYIAIEVCIEYYKEAHISCARQYMGEIERLKGLIKILYDTEIAEPCKNAGAADDLIESHWQEFKEKHNL